MNGRNMGVCREMVPRSGNWVECCRLQGFIGQNREGADSLQEYLGSFCSVVISVVLCILV